MTDDWLTILPRTIDNKTLTLSICARYYTSAPRLGALSDDARLTSVSLTSVCLSRTSGPPKSTTERPRKTKIGTEVAHVTRDSDTTFKVKGSKVDLQGRWHILAASHTAFVVCVSEFCTTYTSILGTVICNRLTTCRNRLREKKCLWSNFEKWIL